MTCSRACYASLKSAEAADRAEASAEARTKRCTKCGTIKSFDDFSPHRLGVGGVRSICKPCSVKATTAGRQTASGAAVHRRASKKYRATPGGSANRVAWNRADILARPAKYLLIRARTRAKQRGVAFAITEADIVIPERCPVLGTRLVIAQKVFRGRGVGGEDDSMSLDRIRPELGYVPGNVAVISWRANRLKGSATLEELTRLVEWLRQVSSQTNRTDGK